MASIFVPGTGGTLKSTTLPAAVAELSRLLNTAENTRNGANPGLTPRQNLSVNISFDTGVIAIAATLPIGVALVSGQPVITAQDYLGSAYTVFAGGTGGDAESTNLIAAFLEVSQLLSAAEKAVTPAENQPNNIQISYDLEAGNATVSANLPFTATSNSTGDVLIGAIDYL